MVCLSLNYVNKFGKQKISLRFLIFFFLFNCTIITLFPETERDQKFCKLATS